MYFAVEQTSPNLPVQIAQEIEALQEQHEGAPFHVIALVDGAFDEQFFKLPPQIRWPRISLYANTSLESLGAAAPQLTTYRPQSRELTKWLETLFSQCSGKPMLSIFASAQDAESLQRHLLPFLVCRTEDSIEWPVRWGDTRILPALMESLPPSQREQLLGPIYCWWTASREGSELRWKGDGNAACRSTEFDKLPMDESTFAELVDQSEADAILNSIYDSQPDLLRDQNPVSAHATVSRQLKFATSHRIEAARARQHFSVLALMLWDGFARHPAMAEVLNRVRSGNEYFAEIAKLPQSFWDVAEEARS